MKMKGFVFFFLSQSRMLKTFGESQSSALETKTRNFTRKTMREFNYFSLQKQKECK